MKSQFQKLTNLRQFKPPQQKNNKQIVNETFVHSILSIANKRQFFGNNALQQSQQQFKLHQTRIQDLRPFVQKLYESSSYANASLFGFNIRSLKKQLASNSKFNLKLVWTLFQTLKWQNIPIKNLQQYIQNFPQSENQVQDIQIQYNKLKLFKLGMCLQMDPNLKTFKVVPKNHQLNRFTGRDYQKSITKIQNQLNSFQFNDRILQIQSNDYMIAVRTESKLFIINPDNVMKSFSIPCLDIKVSENRCYFARPDGSIGSLFMQTLYVPKLHQLALEDNIYKQTLKQHQFLVSSDNTLVIVQVNLQNQYISVRKLQGNKNYFKLNIQTQYNQNLVSKKAFIKGNYLYLFLILGFSKNITKILQYKFYLVFS